MKKLSKILILPVLILCSMFVLSACGETGEKKDGLTLNSAFKTEYYVGETLDVTGGILDFTKNGETTQIIIENSMVSGFSSETAATRNMVVSHTDAGKTYTITVKYVVKEIPAYPLDATGTVKYKSATTMGSNGNYGAMMFTGTQIQVGYYSDDMTWELEDATTSHSSIHSREFNKAKGCWEIITKARNGVYFKLTDITEDSFTLEGYKMANTDGLTETEIDPILEGAVLQDRLHINKVA